jgi:hypothetical protein
MEKEQKFTTVAELIAYHRVMLMELKAPQERAEKLLEIIQREKKRCDNVDYISAVNSTPGMVQAMNDVKLSQELQASMLALSEFLTTGYIGRYYIIDHKPELHNEIMTIIGER